MVRTAEQIEVASDVEISIGRVDYARLDATTEDEIAGHIREDEEAFHKAVGDQIRQIRLSLGMSQHRFADAIHISVKTLRNWEQGLRLPTGPARTLLKIIQRQPQLALSVLEEESRLSAKVKS
jgi:putative transcriptional regulator